MGVDPRGGCVSERVVPKDGVHACPGFDRASSLFPASEPTPGMPAGSVARGWEGGARMRPIRRDIWWDGDAQISRIKNFQTSIGDTDAFTAQGRRR